MILDTLESLEGQVVLHLASMLGPKREDGDLHPQTQAYEGMIISQEAHAPVRAPSIWIICTKLGAESIQKVDHFGL